MYTITYQGAPYGDSETGHVVSRHYKANKALIAYLNLQEQARYYNCITIRDKDGNPVDPRDLI